MVTSTTENVQTKGPKYGVGGAKRQYTWEPAEDITTWELAQALTLLHVGPLIGLRIIPPQVADAVYESFPAEVQRHFQVHERSSILVAGG